MTRIQYLIETKDDRRENKKSTTNIPSHLQFEIYIGHKMLYAKMFIQIKKFNIGIVFFSYHLKMFPSLQSIQGPASVCPQHSSLASSSCRSCWRFSQLPQFSYQASREPSYSGSFLLCCSWLVWSVSWAVMCSPSREHESLVVTYPGFLATHSYEQSPHPALNIYLFSMRRGWGMRVEQSCPDQS